MYIEHAGLFLSDGNHWANFQKVHAQIAVSTA